VSFVNFMNFMEIESFSETYTHTSNSMIQGFCCFCFSVRQSDPGYGIFDSVLICIYVLSLFAVVILD
jgi:hypothetical protein